MKVSRIEIAAFVAIALFSMVASIYRPFYVNALGSLTLPPFIEIENFDCNASIQPYQVVNLVSIEQRCTPLDAMHFIALMEQEFGKVSHVLSGDAGN